MPRETDLSTQLAALRTPLLRFAQQMLLLRRALRGQQAGDDEPDAIDASKRTPP